MDEIIRLVAALETAKDQQKVAICSRLKIRVGSLKARQLCSSAPNIGTMASLVMGLVAVVFMLK